MRRNQAAQLSGSRKPPNLPPGSYRRILHDLLGILGRADDRQDGAVGARSLGLDQPGKGDLVAQPGRRDQLPLHRSLPC
jgi:hypothetical protein